MEGYCDGAAASVSRLSDKLIKEENKLQLPPFEIQFHFFLLLQTLWSDHTYCDEINMINVMSRLTHDFHIKTIIYGASVYELYMSSLF